MVESYFCNARKIDGVWIFSVEDCLDEFRSKFPDAAVVRQLFVETLQRCVTNYRETGNVIKKGGGRPSKRTHEVVEEATQIMENDPQTSLRQLSQQINLSMGTCHRLLRKDANLYPYRFTSVQELLPLDIPQRLNFCQWFLDTFGNNGDVLQMSFFTDEAWFYKQGYVNSQNMRMWSGNNPHQVVEAPLHPEKVGVWAAVSARRVIGPIFFEGNINAEKYRQEILQVFIGLLHDDELRRAYFQQDGARPHCTHETLQFLREYFDDRIISRNTDIPWPARSCDLTPCDFCLWPYIKNSIYRTPINDLDDLKQRISDKFQEINNTPQFLINAINGITNRALKCIQADGGHFNHLL